MKVCTWIKTYFAKNFSIVASAFKSANERLLQLLVNPFLPLNFSEAPSLFQEGLINPPTMKLR